MPTKEASSPLIGTWTMSGGSWEITGGPVRHQVVEKGAIGATGKGVAVLHPNDQVTMEIANALFGKVVYNLALDRPSNTLSGSVFGVPMVARRGEQSPGPGTGHPPVGMPCPSCFGSGRRSCPTCRGSGMYQRPGMSQPALCTLCSGGKVRCEACGGSGKARR